MQELIEELKANDVAHGMFWIEQPNDFFEKYLEKEKEQIEKDFKNGLLDAWNNGTKWDYYEDHYYNQTYNQNK